MNGLTEQQTEAATGLKEAHERFVAADRALIEDGDVVRPAHLLEYLIARNLLREATEKAERAFGHLMP